MFLNGGDALSGLEDHGVVFFFVPSLAIPQGGDVFLRYCLAVMPVTRLKKR